MRQDVQEIARQLGIVSEDLEDILDKANEILAEKGICVEILDGMLFLKDKQTGALRVVEDIEPLRSIIQQTLHSRD